MFSSKGKGNADGEDGCKATSQFLHSPSGTDNFELEWSNDDYF